MRRVAELIHRLPLPADRQRSPYDTRNRETHGQYDPRR